MAARRVTETGLPLIYVNQVGGQDELVFDGASFVLNAGGETVAQALSWEPDLAVTTWDLADGLLTPKPSRVHEAPSGSEAISIGSAGAGRRFLPDEPALVPLYHLVSIHNAIGEAMNTDE